MVYRRVEVVMKLFHLSDLHLGKKVNEFSMMEDQAYILAKIIEEIDQHELDGVVIAGDIYDKSVPSAEAVRLFDEFLVKLAKRHLDVYVISGNHDSPERIAFGHALMEASKVYMSPVYHKDIQPIVKRDAYGEYNVYLLPFIKPAHVRAQFPDAKIESYSDALQVAIEHLHVDPSQRNIIVTHQFVSGAERCESEDLAIGGSDQVSADVFKDFDYVALGHLHKPQKVSRESIRYCGSPLKYSFSEANHKKSITVMELKEKGVLALDTIALVPKRDLREYKGTYEELTSKAFYETIQKDDYVHLTLTDEEDVVDALQKLRTIYPNIMKMDYDNQRTRTSSIITRIENVEQKTPYALCEEFYEIQNGQPMSNEQQAYMQRLIEQVWEGKA